MQRSSNSLQLRYVEQFLLESSFGQKNPKQYPLLLNPMFFVDDQNMKWRQLERLQVEKLLFNLDVFKQLVLLARAWHCLQTMPPRKKQRTLGGAAAAKSFASGSDTPLLATTVDALPKVQKDCLSILDSIYGLRHCQESMVYTEPRGLLTPEPNGLFSFPVCWGGTFKDIAQRAWSEPDKLLQLSTQLAFDAGFLDEADEDEFLQQFCKLDVS